MSATRYPGWFVLAAWLTASSWAERPVSTVAARTPPQSTVAHAVPAAAYKDLRWRHVGASRGGRVTGLAGVRQRPHTFYAGAAGGGVWKTDDAGITWAPIGDGQLTTGSIGSIDVAPSNPGHVWVGTGSAPIRSNVIIGRGVFKSTDAGKSFQFMGLKESGQIGGLRVHPTNPDVVWIAALGSPFGPNEERGVFKTTDGGKTWKKTLHVDAEHGGRDLEVDHQNPDIVYAAVYRGFRKGWDIISGGPADKGGIYKSTDGGETWRHMTAGLPKTLIGKIDLDIARSNPKVLYAMVEAAGAEGGLYKSTDAGESWTIVNNSARLRARPFYFHYVTVSPKNELEVYVSELAFNKSLDGGKTFTTIDTPHADNHGLWINPDNTEIMLQVNDGGANVTLNGGKSWSSILNQPHAEYYMVAVDEQYPYRLYVPQQDNTTLIVPSVPAVSWSLDHPAQTWMQGSGCETGQIWPRRDGRIVWGACKGEVGRYSVATGQETHYWVYPQNRYGHDPDEIKYRFPRQTVVYLSPHDDNVVYQASHVVHRSTDEGLTWQVVSGDLTAREPELQIVPGNPITRDITGEEVYSSIYAMVESRLEKGVLWVGANDGPVHVSPDNGKTWKNVTPKDLGPGGRVQTIEDSPHKKGTAYIAVYRFLREHDLKPYIYKTENYGETWTLLTGDGAGIPLDHPTRVVREDPKREGLLYAGTEFGIFVSFNGGRSWQSLQQNLPATPVTDIRAHRNDVIVSTMGRGLWIMDDVTTLHELTAGARTTRALPPVHLFQPGDVIRYRYTPTASSPIEAEYPVAGAHFDLWFEQPPPGDVRLDVLGAKGEVVRSFGLAQPRNDAGQQEMRGPFRRLAGSSSLRSETGMQRFIWDMRYAGPWAPNAPDGGPGGPIAAPGKYSVRLTANGRTETRAFALRADPRVLEDRVTTTDLTEQVAFQLRVRDAISDARRLQQQVEQALQKRTLAPPGPAPAGVRPMDVKFAHPLQKLWATIVDMPGPYPQPMLINQLSTIARMVGQADQKVGKDALDRFNDVMSDLKAARDELAKLTVPTASVSAVP